MTQEKEAKGSTSVRSISLDVIFMLKMFTSRNFSVPNIVIELFLYCGNLYEQLMNKGLLCNSSNEQLCLRK